MYQLTGNAVKSIPEKISNNVRFIQRNGDDCLVVSFSAFTSFGQEQKYNYINSISSKNALLSFLDTNTPLNDPRGTYYLNFADNDLFSYIKSAGTIIDSVAKENKIPKEKIYIIGSSKGAVGALLCSFVCHYDNVIINAPQFRIGSYVKRRSTEILESMLSMYDLKYLDNIMNDVIIKSEKQPNNIVITCGIDDLYHIKELNMYEELFISKRITYNKIIFSGGHDNESILNYRAIIDKIIP
ncbi:MAG: hypothetical protein E6X49_04615 [Leclercia adecarboxylata]|nr:hypothetical protein [uncultured Leclercia sp.]MDU4840417.1 hypothetical protein [Leclercia adecarboxylata]